MNHLSGNSIIDETVCALWKWLGSLWFQYELQNITFLEPYSPPPLFPYSSPPLGNQQVFPLKVNWDQCRSLVPMIRKERSLKWEQSTSKRALCRGPDIFKRGFNHFQSSEFRRRSAIFGKHIPLERCTWLACSVNQPAPGSDNTVHVGREENAAQQPFIPPAFILSPSALLHWVRLQIAPVHANC